MRPFHFTWILAGLIFGVGCSPSPKSAKGFTLPTGDIDAGKATFVSLQCNACHSLSGIEEVVEEGVEAQAKVALGGEVSRIATYGELVTSIINPSHRLASGHQVEDIASDGVSRMKNYNEVLTVQQLCDLVAFLQSKYTLRKYEPTHYPEYGPYM